jgi:hypothetical protein
MQSGAFATLLVGALAFALGFLPLTLRAGTVTFQPGTDEAFAILESEAKIHVDAVYRRTREIPNALPTGRRLKNLHAALRGQVVAVAKYIHPDGTKLTYYARSGHSIDRTLNKFKPTGLTSSSGLGSSSGSGSASSGEAPEFVLDDDIARDRYESRYYPKDANRIRAPLLADEDSDLHPIDTGDQLDHARDAELKIFRKMEADIKSGFLPKGGRIEVFVSKPLCASCRNASSEFARDADADIVVHHLIEPEKDGAPGTDETIARSQDKSKDLVESRRSYIEERFPSKRLILKECI